MFSMNIVSFLFLVPSFIVENGSIYFWLQFIKPKSFSLKERDLIIEYIEQLVKKTLPKRFEKMEENTMVT